MFKHNLVKCINNIEIRRSTTSGTSAKRSVTIVAYKTSGIHNIHNIHNHTYVPLYQHNNLITTAVLRRIHRHISKWLESCNSGYSASRISDSRGLYLNDCAELYMLIPPANGGYPVPSADDILILTYLARSFAPCSFHLTRSITPLYTCI